MKILAIDTSSKNASVAILEDLESLIELNNNDITTHSQKLMPMIDEAFQKTNLNLDDINLISCCLGPGSFTGVRIGIATAKAFHDAKNIPVCGISSLEGLCYNVLNNLVMHENIKENSEVYVCSLIDAGHGNMYAGLFKFKLSQNLMWQTIQSDLSFLDLKDNSGIVTANALLDFIKEHSNENTTIYFVGDAVVLYKDILQNIPNFKLSSDNLNVASAISIGKSGYVKFKNGTCENLSPIYLRKSQAELALETKL